MSASPTNWEEYKFAGFSRVFELYAEVESYWINLLKDTYEHADPSGQWSIISSTSGLADDSDGLRRRFKLQPDEVNVWCHSASKQKGVRVIVIDPLVTEADKSSDWAGIPYLERPALITAFMDIFGDREPGVMYSRDLVITCELSTRTERLAKELICAYIFDDCSYEEMGQKASEVSKRELEVGKQRED